MLKHLVSILVIFIFHYTTFAQKVLPYTGTTYNGKNFISVNKYLSSYEDKAGTLTIEKVIRLKKNGIFKNWDSAGVFNMGITKSVFWIFIRVRNMTDKTKEAVYKISTGVDSTMFYEMDKSGKGHLLYETSRYTPFLKRPFVYRYTAFPIKLVPGTTKYFFIRLQNRMAGTYTPMSLESREHFYRKEIERHWIYGIYFGLFILVIVFNTFLFLSMKDTIHLWYAAYVLFAIIFMIQDENFYTEIYPNSWLYFCENAKQFPFSSLMIATGSRVMQLFVKQEKQNSYLYWPVSIIIILGFVISSAILTISFLNALEIRESLRFLFRSVDVLFPVSVLFLLISLIEKIIQKQYLAIYYFIAIVILLLGAFNYYFNHISVTSRNYVQPNGVVVGLAFEITILSLLLTLRYAKLKREKEILISHQKQKLAEAVIESQEIERLRVARDLHDGIGSSLIGIRLMLENYFSNYKPYDHNDIAYRSKLMNSLKSTSLEVRNISHDLSPKDIEISGLFQTLNNLIDSLNTHESGIEFSFIQLGENLAIEKKHEINILRIVNELLTNIIKHSGASKASLQCLYYNNTLQLIMEDNGKGFNEDEIKEGMGLRNIRSRIDYMNGILTIDSGIMGTTCLIEISLVNI